MLETGCSNEEAELNFLAHLRTLNFDATKLPPLEEIEPSLPKTYVAAPYGNLLLTRVFSVTPVDIVIELRAGDQIAVASGKFDAVGQPETPWRIMGSMMNGTYLRVRGAVFGDRVEHRIATNVLSSSTKLSLIWVEPFASEVVSGEAGKEIHAYPILRASYRAKISANGRVQAVGHNSGLHTLSVNVNGNELVDSGAANTAIDLPEVQLPTAAALHARIVGTSKPDRVRLSATKLILP